MLQGKVKWFDPKKGYGFIKKGNGDEIFVHYSEIEDTGFKKLEEGQKVTFDQVETDHGIQAQSVAVVEG